MQVALARRGLAGVNVLLVGCLALAGWSTFGKRLAPAGERVPSFDPTERALARTARTSGVEAHAVIWELLEKPLPVVVEKPPPPTRAEAGIEGSLRSIYVHPDGARLNQCIVEASAGGQVVLAVGESWQGFTCRAIEVNQERGRAEFVSSSGKSCVLEIRRE